MSGTHYNSRISIPIDHPNVRNAESFLSSWSEPFDLQKREGNRFTFCSVISDMEVTVIFFTGYQEAVDYEKRHFLPRSSTACSTINGSALYVILGSDPEMVSSLAGHFAGRE